MSFLIDTQKSNHAISRGKLDFIQVVGGILCPEAVGDVFHAGYESGEKLRDDLMGAIYSKRVHHSPEKVHAFVMEKNRHIKNEHLSKPTYQDALARVYGRAVNFERLDMVMPKIVRNFTGAGDAANLARLNMALVMARHGGLVVCVTDGGEAGTLCLKSLIRKYQAIAVSPACL